MSYFDFSGTLSRWDVFVHAAVFTVGLSIAATMLGLVIGVAGAVARLALPVGEERCVFIR